MSLEIIGLIIHPFINVAAFLVILSKSLKLSILAFLYLFALVLRL